MMMSLPTMTEGSVPDQSVLYDPELGTFAVRCGLCDKLLVVSQDNFVGELPMICDECEADAAELQW